jgi:hypothetical protein
MTWHAMRVDRRATRSMLVVWRMRRAVSVSAAKRRNNWPDTEGISHFSRSRAVPLEAVMKVLVACEESQAVTVAFRERGHEAYSCDLLPASGGHPEWHIQADALTVLDDDWDLVLAFPPCTHLACSGARYFTEKRADGRQKAAVDFFMRFAGCRCERVAIENPVGIMSTVWRKQDEIIQPWQFGHGETKATCLWLKNLPILVPTDIVSGRVARVHRMAPSPERARLRSKTYGGIAAAMAEQWGHI